MVIAKKGDFVEIQFTGRSNGIIFDSNIEEDLKKLDSKAKPRKVIVVVGERMIVPGLDKSLAGKEIKKKFSVHLNYKEGFGERKRDLVKTIPLSVFTSQEIMPEPGKTLLMDNMLAKIITISGARVITDFNNPLAGKDLDYEFTITRIVEDLKEKAEAFFEFNLRFVPETEVKDNKVIVKAPEFMESFIKSLGEKFRQLSNAEIEFVEKDLSPSVSASD